MTTVQISPEVKLQEIHQLVSHLQNRNLFLAESFRTVRDIGLEYERQIAEKDARIAELEHAVTEARAMVVEREGTIAAAEEVD